MKRLGGRTARLTNGLVIIGGLFAGLTGCGNGPGEEPGAGGQSPAGAAGSGGLSGMGGMSGGSSSAGGSSAGTSGTGGALGTAGAGNAGSTGGGGVGGSSSGGTSTGGAPAGGVSGSGGGVGGSGGSGTEPYNPCPPAGTDCTIMPLGDSITDGYTVRGGYRIPFFQRAHQEGKQFTFVGSATNGPEEVDGVPFPRRHEGHSAYTINDEPSIPRNGIAPLIEDVIPEYHPDIVLLMIGTNDCDREIDLPNLPQRLGALIDSIIAFDEHTLIVVAQITPTMQDPFNERIEAYNAAIPAIVSARADAGKHVVLVDMYGAFTADPDYRSKYLADRQHPNAAGYEKMSETWSTVVYDLLR